MKKLFPCDFFFIFLIIAGCSTSHSETEAESNLPVSKGIHFSPNHGTSNVPLNIFKEDDMFHLFYSTGSSEWGHATSPNMIHWTSQGALNAKVRNVGDIVSKKKAGDSTYQWVMFFLEDNTVKSLISNNRNEWESNDLSTSPLAGGIPKINKLPNDGWMMTITNEETISFYQSQDLYQWTAINSVANDYEAEFAELATIDGASFLVIDGYAIHVKMELEEGKYMARDKYNMPQKLKGTFFQSEGVNYLIYSLEDNMFSTPMEASVNAEGDIQLAPSSLLRKQVLVKRRGRLNNLVGGDMPTWFSFKVDDTNRSTTLLLSNELDEVEEVSIQRKTNSYSISFNEIVQDVAWTSNDAKVSFEILVDQNYIGIFFAGKSHVVSTPSVGSFPKKIQVLNDGADINPPAIVYSISEEPY